MNTPALTVKSLLSQANVKSKFEEILRERTNAFTANLAVMVNNNAALSRCEPMTVISAAVVAASLDLLIDPNLGYAHIVPYGDKAQFQIGFKGFIQLAMRSGQYQRIGVAEIYDGQLIEENPLTGEYVFDFKAKKDETIIGWAAYFKTINGFEKTLYWPVEKIDKHGKRFSQTYKKGFGLWKDDFNAMASKTVLKALLSKWGILSTEMQRAVRFDQSVVKSVENQEVEYIDNDLISEAFDEPVKAKKVEAEKLVK